ncbi:hypothetical protein BDM02DRAFT_3185311 [Thelephora ganbajun]|uniref:Uncharacterized protein n=1 Tax=Thelephora ganbajun TaxID=370292 RepID=A0ACB6ZLK1_THEGA|nr:hypothetical protein BDM02DRAFT_3185311 [Thelephora ganbajun]
MAFEIGTQLALGAERVEALSIEDRSSSTRTTTLEDQPSLGSVICDPHPPLNMTTPIDRLPVELLQTIFRITLPIRTKAHVLQVLQTAHVCRYWRAAAQSCTELWSSIFIDDTPPDFVTRCLELGGQSLIVYIDLRVTVSFSLSEYMIKRQLLPNDVKSINLLLEHPEHVRTLDIKAPFRHQRLLTPLIDACRVLFPYVSRLGWADVSVDPQNVDVTIPYPLPHLRHLSLYRNYGAPIIDEVSGLKSLRWTVEDLSPKMFIELLQRNQGLESITLSDCTCYTGPEDPRPVSLPNLKSLIMIDCIEMAQYLEPPLLSSLPVLRVCNGGNTSYQTGFWFSSPDDPSLSLRVTVGSLNPFVTAMLAPFFKGVTTFGLHQFANHSRFRFHQSQEELDFVWTLLPFLRVLEVTWSQGLDRVLQPLLDYTDICPRLSRIEISPSSNLIDDRGALDFFPRLLKSRVACGKPLPEIVLSHKLNPDGSPKELTPLPLRDWFRGYPSSPEGAVDHPSFVHLDTFDFVQRVLSRVP